MSKWNGKRFSIYTSDEENVLGLLNEIGNASNLIDKDLQELSETVEKGLNSKTDLHGDHLGSWQGLTKPTLSDAGLKATVEKNIDTLNNINTNIIPSLNAQLDTKVNKNELTNGLTPKGNVSYSSLPRENNNIGDFYYCSDGVDGVGNYVWNGTEWYFGGSVDEGYNKLNNIIEYKNIGKNDGYVSYTTGKVSTYDGLYNSDLIPVLPSTIINIDLGAFNLNKADARGLAFFDNNKSYITGVQYQPGTPIPKISCTVPEGCYYFKFTYKETPKLHITTSITNVVKKCLEVTSNDSNTIDYTDKVNENYTNGAFLNATNGKFVVYNNSSSISEYIPCEKNDVVKLVNPQKFTDVRGLAFYTEDKQFISGLKYDSEEITVTVPPTAKYFAITIVEGFKLLYICNGNTPKQTMKKMDILNPINYDGNEISIFTKCCCIGDSLTRGVFNDNSTGQVVYVGIEKYGYPKRLQDLTGIECVNLGQGGHTTKSWYQLYQNKDLTGYDMAIINLGANDTTANGMTPEIGEEYLQKIVDKLSTSNKGIKIFLATILPAYYNRNTALYYNVNAKIKNVVDKNVNCYLVDLSLFSKCTNDTPYAEGHLTALGYNEEAKELKSMISYIISKNMNDFKYVHFINSEYSFN